MEYIIWYDTFKTPYINYILFWTHKLSNFVPDTMGTKVYSVFGSNKNGLVLPIFLEKFMVNCWQVAGFWAGYRVIYGWLWTMLPQMLQF